MLIDKKLEAEIQKTRQAFGQIYKFIYDHQELLPQTTMDNWYNLLFEIEIELLLRAAGEKKLLQKYQTQTTFQKKQKAPPVGAL
jgi:hypothetical protein